jgi:DNA-binding NarL/FixJ family response regulator
MMIGNDPPTVLGDTGDTQTAVRAAVAAERARIVREMDETVSKSLFGVSMIAASLASAPSLADPQTLDQRLRELARLARLAVSDARCVIKDQREEVSPPVRVVMADRNPVLRRGLAAAFECAPGIEIAAETDNGKDAVALVRRHHPDVLLLDVGMLLTGGSATIQQISQQTQVVMLTCADDSGLLTRAVAAGACGYVMHGKLEQSELIQVVLDAAWRMPMRSVPASADMTGSLSTEDGRARSYPGGLRPREREIMELIAEGLSNRQIAARLVISDKTVKNHICSIYQRLGVQERSQAVSRWRELCPDSGFPGRTSS